jgi:hypothetical protein
VTLLLLLLIERVVEIEGGKKSKYVIN